MPDSISHIKPRTIGFLLVPNFTMVAVTSAIEPLRLAEYVTGHKHYNWVLISPDGNPVKASNGISMPVDMAMNDAEKISLVFVCGGEGTHSHDDRRTSAWLRKIASRGVKLGALCTGSAVLARAGLLNGYRCTIHWENLAGFAERYPDIDVTMELFEIDRDRFTCSGGTAALDLSLNIMAMDFGHDLASQAADQLLHERIRDRHDHQRMPLRFRLGTSHPKLIAIVAHMEENLEEPLSCAELADVAHLSTRHLERLFRKYFNKTPTRYYLELRLNRARLLLLQTDLSILSVALACGFVSASHFTKCYRDYFGHTPRAERRPLSAQPPTEADMTEIDTAEIDPNIAVA